MLMASSNCSFAPSSASFIFSALPPAVATSSKFSMPGVFSGPSRTTCLRCGSLPPFTRPDARTVAPPPQLAPRPAHVLMTHHQRLAVAMGLDGAVEEGADRLADQLLGRNAMVVRDFGGILSNRHAASLAGRGRFEIMKLDFVTVDVFTDRRFGGNPLAVLSDARGLTAGQMQSIAAEFNLAETTFVLPPQDPAHTAEVRIFTPRAELPFAGHPNVGTAFVLARLRRRG